MDSLHPLFHTLGLEGACEAGPFFKECFSSLAEKRFNRVFICPSLFYSVKFEILIIREKIASLEKLRLTNLKSVKCLGFG